MMKRSFYGKKKFVALLALLAVAVLLSSVLTVGAAAYDGGTAETDGARIALRVVIGLAIGFAAGLTTVLLMRRSMNTVRKQKNASVYTEKDSFALTESRDIYLYSRVTRTRVQSNNNNRR